MRLLNRQSGACRSDTSSVFGLLDYLHLIMDSGSRSRDLLCDPQAGFITFICAVLAVALLLMPLT